MTNVVSYHCVRNEEKIIEKMIKCLQNQELKIKRIIIVNDGSTDKTSEIAKNMGVDVIDLPNENKDRRTTGDFAKLPNAALKTISEDYDYVLNCGADHILPPNYLSYLTNEMNLNKKLGICSGYIKGEKRIAPAGSGAVTRFAILKNMNLQYPVKYGYESYLLYKSLQLGYENKVFDIETYVLRPTRKTYTKEVYQAYGRSYRALGYDKLFLVAKLLLECKKSMKGSFYQLMGYLDRNVELHDEELRNFIKQTQKKRLTKEKLKNIMKRSKT